MNLTAHIINTESDGNHDIIIFMKISVCVECHVGIKYYIVYAYMSISTVYLSIVHIL